MSIENQIKEQLKLLDDPEECRKLMKVRQVKLHQLVDKWGIENVALASDLSVTTINQYLRSKLPQISERAVEQASRVLANIK